MYLDLEPWYINKVGRYIEITIEPGSRDRKYEAPTSGKRPRAVSGIAKTCMDIQNVNEKYFAM
jgi:hypothetical protein